MTWLTAILILIALYLFTRIWLAWLDRQEFMVQCDRCEDLFYQDQIAGGLCADCLIDLERATRPEHPHLWER